MSAPTLVDGGPIGPIPSGMDPSSGAIQYENHGMSLLDWFAGQALAGIMPTLPDDCEYQEHMVARNAYKLATAMLNEKGRIARTFERRAK